MFLKKVQKSHRMLAEEALIRRLPENHPKIAKINENLANRIAGYRGEQALGYQLQRLEKTDFYIMQDLRLKQGELHFQIDTLLVSPTFILIIEVKNISGLLFLDTKFKQMYRTKDDIIEGLKYPISQVNYHEELLRLWLTEHRLHSLPVEHLIAFANQSSVLKTNDTHENIYEKVFHVDSIIEQIRMLQQKYEDRKPKRKLAKNLCDAVLHANSPIQTDVLDAFHINKNELRAGVQCPSCYNIPMKRKKGVWRCDRCEYTSEHAHKQAICDYLCLFEPTISNKQAMRFLHIKSRNTMLRILKDMDLQTEGNTKGRRYRLGRLVQL
ncbi:nuclease-related domain-containing protein [Radiobacillus sp. PE A8.2]|uniref:nuclease-related domain-containing protein n=1 Tax=Radiobacillus sp. PE A8.2 TaxID=3380349 RepID=UPI00388DBE2D